MIELLIIGASLVVAARWLQHDAHRRDHDPQSQVRSDWLEFLSDDRDGTFERIKRGGR